MIHPSPDLTPGEARQDSAKDQQAEGEGYDADAAVQRPQGGR
jgi:hypothetical protein